jgi:hypothetical protein
LFGVAKLRKYILLFKYFVVKPARFRKKPYRFKVGIGYICEIISNN